MARTDTSYGVIPLRKVNGQWQVLLINQYSKIGDNTYWVFPKGHPVATETPIETATRELGEETGLEAEQLLAEPTFTINYTFTYEGEEIQKTVDFYLAFVPVGELTLDPEEVKEAKWLPLTEAQVRLDYEDTKTLFQTVIDYLHEHPALFE